MTVLVYPDVDRLTQATAARLILTLADTQALRQDVHVAISGGSVGSQLLAAVPESELKDLVDWSAVHFWWVDERFVPSGHADRNDAATDAVFFQRLAVPEQNLHRMATSDDTDTLETGVQAYSEELARFAAPGESMLIFDLVLLGMGPDGHVASLFPGHEILNHATAGDSTRHAVLTVGITDAPKAPSQRISLTFAAINRARRIWVPAWGKAKASAVAGALAGRPIHDLPAAGIEALGETLWLLDVDSASEIPPAQDD